MILVDTSIWIDHFQGRASAGPMLDLLDAKQVVVHPLVRGELALGNLGRRRAEILEALQVLPATGRQEVEEVLWFVGEHRLYGGGLSLVDAHLLHIALAEGHLIWTRDKPLAKSATHYARGYVAG